MPKCKTLKKELDRGRLLFYVTFESGRGYLNHNEFDNEIKNA